MRVRSNRSVRTVALFIGPIRFRFLLAFGHWTGAVVIDSADHESDTPDRSRRSPTLARAFGHDTYNFNCTRVTSTRYALVAGHGCRRVHRDLVAAISRAALGKAVESARDPGHPYSNRFN